MSTTITTTHGPECERCAEAAEVAKAQHKAMPAVCGATLEFEGVEHEARLG